MNDLPQTAVDHLYPFVVLGVLSLVTLIALLRGLMGARAIVREESIEALKTEAGKAVLRAVVGEAVTGMIEPLKDAVAEQRRSAISQGERISKLEHWQARADVALSVLAKHEERLTRHERWVVEFGKILKRAKITDSEEIG